MDSLDVIRTQLRSEQLSDRTHAAWQLSQQPEAVELVIDDLVQSIDNSLRELARESKAAQIAASFGVMALSNSLSLAVKSSRAAGVAESQLLRLAGSSIAAIAGTAIFWIGQLHGRGAFAWDFLKSLAKSSGIDDDSVTLRAFAYRALLSIDESKTLSLGELQAKQDLHNSIMPWMAQAHSEEAIAEFERLLDMTKP